jgi:hypothetical protein
VLSDPAGDMADLFKTGLGAPGEIDSMTNKPDLTAAASFLAGTARVLDQRHFERLFSGGEAAPVRDAVAAYRNADGGFGHGLEPDCRCPATQPAAIEMALRILDEADAWDTGLVDSACDWLDHHQATGGGATFVEATLEGWPHAPWWVYQDGRPASLTQTGLIAGTLHDRRVQHPWLTGATEVMWDAIARLSSPGPYDLLGVVRFLDRVPDRDRAWRAFDVIGPMLLEPDIVALDPDAPGEVHSPLEFAPRPQSLARQLFDSAVIEAHLDHLAAGQQDDGGWMFNWLAWSPAAAADWRGFLTVDALRVLRANGRL